MFELLKDPTVSKLTLQTKLFLFWAYLLIFRIFNLKANINKPDQIAINVDQYKNNIVLDETCINDKS